MSEHAASAERRVRSAAGRSPGGAHDRWSRTLKLGLPALIGVVLAFLFFAPLEDKQEVSFLLDKNKVETAEERLRVAAAQYRGQDNAGPAVHPLRPLGACSRPRRSRSSRSAT